MTQMIRKSIVTVLVIISCLAHSTAFAAISSKQKTPRSKPDNFMRVAVMLVRQGQNMQKSTSMSKRVKTTTSAYTCAGQLFELASKEYKMLLMRKQASQKDVDAAINGMKFCVASAHQIKMEMASIKR